MSSIWALCGGATGGHVTGSDVAGSVGSHVTRSDDSHLTGSDPVRKYVMCKCNQKLRHIYPSEGPLTRSDVSHVTGRGPVRKWSYSEVGSAHARIFPAFFSLVVVTGLSDVSFLHVLFLRRLCTLPSLGLVSNPNPGSSNRTPPSH